MTACAARGRQDSGLELRVQGLDLRVTAGLRVHGLGSGLSSWPLSTISYHRSRWLVAVPAGIQRTRQARLAALGYRQGTARRVLRVLTRARTGAQRSCTARVTTERARVSTGRLAAAVDLKRNADDPRMRAYEQRQRLRSSCWLERRQREQRRKTSEPQTGRNEAGGLGLGSG